jgi:hypothetical protein
MEVSKMTGYTGIRDTFSEWAEEGGDITDEAEPLETIISANCEAVVTLEEAIDALAGSEDIMPFTACEGLDLPQGTTYGEAVVVIKGRLEDMAQPQEQPTITLDKDAYLDAVASRPPSYTAIRDAFAEWAGEWPDLSDEEDPLGVDISIDGEPVITLKEALEALAGSEDIMPSAACEGLGLPQGSTYGDAVADLIS